ncbi:hypothetical protein FRC06_009257 [Ceratobasidium sp. 370]|nr:hypothetical protein FRC06_009257 [Ceratobasidium sp. 370]
MSASSNAWVIVNNNRTRTTSQSAANLSKDASPENRCDQPRVLNRFRREKEKREPGRIEDDGSSPLQPEVAPPTRRRLLLKSLPNAVVSRLSRNITVSSTGATIGDAEDTLLPSKLPAAPPVPSSSRRKHAQADVQPTASHRPPMRIQTEPAHPQTGPTPLLNVNFIGRVSFPGPPEVSFPGAQAYSFPTLPNPTPQTPLLGLESLPQGYMYATGAYFRSEDVPLRPLRLLSLDGGGVRGISSLRILKAIMDRISPGARPCEYFDLIAGTSTGGESYSIVCLMILILMALDAGLIAIMLGRLRMSVDDCIKQYHRLAKKIFKRNKAAQLGSFASGENRFSPVNLEEAIKSVVAKTSPNNTKMADHHLQCARAFVVAVKKRNVNNQSARRIRTYPTRASPADTCEIWEAGRATSAAPSYFPPIELMDERGQLAMYIDGGLGYNNPSKELLNEAREVFGPNHPIGCFISIGTGRDKNVAVNDVRRAMYPAYGAFKAVALSSEKAHWEMEQYFARQTNVYFRFNAGTRLIGANGDEDFVQAVALEDWQKMERVEELTQEYIREEKTSQKLDKCAQKLASIYRT